MFTIKTAINELRLDDRILVEHYKTPKAVIRIDPAQGRIRVQNGKQSIDIWAKEFYRVVTNASEITR